MWHQARKQEKKLRCLMVDYKKRAERRRNYYELCKKDPCSFLRLQGSSMKIHIDASVAAAAEGPRSMMAWNNDESNMIDRFDVRAHMDYIPDYKSGASLPDALEVEDDMRCNYDRYRIIVQNDCARITEEAALRQIEVDEKFGDVTKNIESEEKKKSLSSKKAAIAFSYDNTQDSTEMASDKKKDDSSDEDEEEDFEDVDLDIAFDIDELSAELKQQLDVVAITYGMAIGEFAEQLTKDKEDEKELREAKIAEQEKAAMSGRKSRKERRLYKETMLRLRGVSPPKYCPPDQTSRDSPSYHRGTSYADSDSSRSASPVADTLEFITNLGDGDTEEQSCNPQSNDTLPPHLRLGTISSAASWKQRQMRTRSPEIFPESKGDDLSISRKQLSPPPIKRYRRKSLEKSDGSGDSSDEEQHSLKFSSRSYKGSSNLSSATKLSSSFNKSNKLSVQEKMKRRMKSAINKTYRADKKTEEEKKDQARKEQQERAEEIRSQAEELRRREYVRRKRSSSPSRSRSRERSPHRSSRKHHSGNREDDYRTSRSGYRHSDSNIRDRSSRESRDRYRDSSRNDSLGRRSRSRERSPNRRRNYR